MWWGLLSKEQLAGRNLAFARYLSLFKNKLRNNFLSSLLFPDSIISDKEGERMLEPYYGMVHILWPDWLAQCIDAQELLPPLASDYLHYAQGAEDIASHLVPFSGCHNEDSVEKLLDAISGNDEAGSLQQLRMAFPAVKQAHLFEGLRLCFLAPPEMKGKLPHSWRYEMSLMEAWAHFHGAEEVSESLNERTTHLVLLLPFKGNLSVRTRSRELESNVDNALVRYCYYLLLFSWVSIDKIQDPLATGGGGVTRGGLR